MRKVLSIIIILSLACEIAYARVCLRVPNMATSRQVELKQQMDFGYDIERKTEEVIIKAETTVGNIKGYGKNRPGVGDGLHARPSERLVDALVDYCKIIEDDLGISGIQFKYNNKTKAIEVNMLDVVNILMTESQKGDEVEVSITSPEKLPDKALIYIAKNIIRALEDEGFAWTNPKDNIENTVDEFKSLVGSIKAANKNPETLASNSEFRNSETSTATIGNLSQNPARTCP